MAKYKIAPTKSNLLKAKKSFLFVTEGHSLLESKREILLSELLNMKERAKQMEKDVDAAFFSAYELLKAAIIVSGKIEIENAALCVKESSGIHIGWRKVMGVDLPRISFDALPLAPLGSMYGGSIKLDEAVAEFSRALKLLINYAQYRVSLLRLAREVKKTTRRVNALERIYIPDYKETVDYIENFLQEQERETFFIQKLIRNNMERRRGDG